MIVPVFNEAQVVEDILTEARLSFPNVVAVDDGSRDESARAIRAAGAHLVRHSVNLGQGAALQTGIEYARAQPQAAYFVTFDADGQHQVSDVRTMVARLRDQPVDLVVGTRFQGAAGRIPIFKRIILKTMALLSVRNRRLKLTDVHNGLRAFNRTVAEQIAITRGGMSHASEILEMADRQHWRVGEEPVTILYTDYSRNKGQSMINGVNILFENALRTGGRR